MVEIAPGTTVQIVQPGLVVPLGVTKGDKGDPGELAPVEGARVVTNAELSIPNATNTTIPGQVEQWDNGGYHDTVTNNTRMTIPAGKAGKYLLTASCRFSANATGSRDLFFLKNGAQVNDAYASYASASGNVVVVSFTSTMALAVGDYAQAAVWQNSGATLTSTAGWASFSITYLGP